MSEDIAPQTPLVASPRFGILKITGLFFLAVIVSVLISLWVVKNYLFVSAFTPVMLTAKEEQVLERKLSTLDMFEATQSAKAEGQVLEAEAYSEVGAKRDISFTEKEINALLAKNTNLSHKLAIDLADGLVSIKLLVPMDEDFPVLGGQTIRLKAGAELAYREARPVVILKGVAVMGVPVPNAWLGGMKNIDLVQEFGGDEGFWKSFSEGVDNILVEEGYLKIQLKE